MVYMIHRIGTPVMAWRNHSSYWESEYWNNDTGWGFKSTGDVFTAEERLTLDLPMDGEWIEILVEQRL